MRFFTLDWWWGLQELNLSRAPIDEYRRHLAAIKDRLPAGLLALQESVSLHDGQLRELDLDLKQGTLLLRVDGDDDKGGLRHFVLRYSGVSSFRSVADPEAGPRSGPFGYGDWGYDEADVTPAGEFEHRILFSTGIEFAVRFTGFELEWEDGA